MYIWLWSSVNCASVKRKSFGNVISQLCDFLSTFFGDLDNCWKNERTSFWNCRCKDSRSLHLKWVLRKAGPRPTACDGPAARWTSSDFPQFFCLAVNSRASTDLHRVWAFGRAKWTTVSLNSFTILIIISILFDPFFPCPGHLPYSNKYGIYIDGKQCLITGSPFGVGFL